MASALHRARRMKLAPGVSSPHSEGARPAPHARRWRRWFLLSGACLALCTLARPASATPAPPRYEVTVDASSVEVCIGPADYRPCDSAMLREDADGGVVSLNYTTPNGGSGPCYVDECVPPGTYRYGCQVPIECGNFAEFYASVTVTEPLNVGCTLPDGSAPPTPVEGGAPWPGNAWPCSSAPSSSSSGGCSSTAGSVYALDGAAVLLSIGLLWRQRRGARRR
jgi:hypothetical protein